MLLREGTNDESTMVADVEEYRHLDVRTGDVVLDIGGHIGLFALQMYERGVRRVVSVEPEPWNHQTHTKNLASYPKHLAIKAAVTGMLEWTTATLHVNPGRNKGRHTVMESAREDGYGMTVVPCINFTGLVDLVRPQVLKVDCESAEYTFNWMLPGYVRSLAIEFHELHNENRLAHCAAIRLGLRNQGFEQTYVTEEQRSFRLFVYRRVR